MTLRQIYCQRPPRSEQDAIVRFLNRQSAKASKLIRAKRRYIELLNEQKRAIVIFVITRGLDRDLRLKPSGIRGIGDVPEHWQVGRLVRFITLQRGFDITKEQQKPGAIPVISSGGVLSYHNERSCIGPGVVIGRKGTVGSVHFVSTDFWAHDTTLWVQAFNGNYPRFVYYLLWFWILSVSIQALRIRL